VTGRKEVTLMERFKTRVDTYNLVYQLKTQTFCRKFDSARDDVKKKTDKYLHTIRYWNHTNFARKQKYSGVSY